MIIYHTGCGVIEEIVLHLTQFFRLNGINAVSELTAEDQIHKYGRGVYLNDMLRQADFVLVLCTEGKRLSASLLHYLLMPGSIPTLTILPPVSMGVNENLMHKCLGAGQILFADIWGGWALRNGTFFTFSRIMSKGRLSNFLGLGEDVFFMFKCPGG